MLSDLKDSGLIDVENIAAQSKINRALTESGVTGFARLQALKNLGVTGQNIGQINIEVNEATGDTLDRAVQGRMLNLFGGR